MPIKFITRYSIYQKGDVVAFAAETAERLIASGIATHAYPQDRAPIQQKMVKKSK